MNTTAADAIDTAEDATASETDRYEEAYRETRRVLDECIETLMIQEEFETDSDRRDQIMLKRKELEAKQEDLRSANIAFHAGRATMNPPSPKLVSEIVALSKKAVELTVERATVAAVLRLSTSALNKFAEIQDLGNA